MTSQFTFLLISITVNPWKMQPYIPVRVKNLKSRSFYAVCASFSSLQSITKKIGATKNRKFTGFQRVNELLIQLCMATIPLCFEFFRCCVDVLQS